MKGFLFTDGGSRGNPGHAGIASLLFNENGKLLDFFGKAYPLLTNNQAEYQALISGINLAIKQGINELDCFLDSELVVNQLNGKYKIKDEKIKQIIPSIDTLKTNFDKITFCHILRENNKQADKLVNLILDAFEQK